MTECIRGEGETMGVPNIFIIGFLQITVCLEARRAGNPPVALSPV